MRWYINNYVPTDLLWKDMYKNGFKPNILQSYLPGGHEAYNLGRNSDERNKDYICVFEYIFLYNTRSKNFFQRLFLNQEDFWRKLFKLSKDQYFFLHVINCSIHFTELCRGMQDSSWNTEFTFDTIFYIAL